MFTGIIEVVAKVVSLTPTQFGARLAIDPCGWDYQPNHGDSIAVAGCCLTYAPGQGEPSGTMGFDLVSESLAHTTLGELKTGDRVNLESCLTPQTRLGGHFVQGHIDGVATVRHINTGSDEWRLTVETPRDLMQYIVPKGSVALDGVSLTIASVNVAANTFDLAIIPTTLEKTTFGELKVGDKINLETDVLVRSVVHALKHFTDGGGLTLEKLRKSGFAD